MQIVAQLEHSLSKERERLQAMMAHLHLTKDNTLKEGAAGATSPLRSKSMLDRNERSQSEGPPAVSPPPITSVDSRVKSPPLKMRPPPVPPLSGAGAPPPGSLAAMQQAVSAAAAAAGGFGHLPNFNRSVSSKHPLGFSCIFKTKQSELSPIVMEILVYLQPPCQL